jgi:hypothetical protein
VAFLHQYTYTRPDRWDDHLWSSKTSTCCHRFLALLLVEYFRHSTATSLHPSLTGWAQSWLWWFWPPSSLAPRLLC